MLGPLKAKRVLSLGESQSAIFLTTYVNAVDPLAKVYDGFFIHSRFGSAPLPDAASIQNRQGSAPQGVKFRPDLRVPVMTLIAESPRDVCEYRRRVLGSYEFERLTIQVRRDAVSMHQGPVPET